MKVWITKYALTQGIYRVEAKRCMMDDDIVAVKGNYISQYFFTEGKDWHRTRESAIKKAEQMRDAKIRSLEKQILKIRKLRFLDA